MENNKRYQWSADAQFTATSKQFGTLYNSLAAIVNTPVFQEELIKARQTIAIAELQQVMNEMLSTHIESGVATEFIPEEQPQEQRIGNVTATETAKGEEIVADLEQAHLPE